jgi:hypothetical protein
MAAILVFIGGIGFINGNIRNDAACSSNTCGNIFGKIVTALRQVSFNIVAFRLQSAAIRAVVQDPGFDGNFDVVRVEELNDGSQLVVARLVDESGVKFHHVDARQRV